MFRFFIKNNLIFPNQSGFRPGDFCVNQLLAIIHKIYKSFDEEFEVGGVFLYIYLKLLIRCCMSVYFSN